MEDYPLSEAQEVGLTVRKCRASCEFHVFAFGDVTLFVDRDIERVRAYLLGFRQGFRDALIEFGTRAAV